MKNVTFVLALVSFFFLNCDRQQFVERQSDKLIGQWDFKRVVELENFSRNNITNKYKNQTITFLENGTMQWQDFETSQYWEGDYNVHYYNDIGGGDQSVESALRLEAQLLDTASNSVKQITLENLNVFNKRMNFDLREEGTTLEIRMIK